MLILQTSILTIQQLLFNIVPITKMTPNTNVNVSDLIEAFDKHYQETVRSLKAADRIYLTKLLIEYVRELQPPYITPYDPYEHSFKEKVYEHFKEKFSSLNIGILTKLLDQEECLMGIEILQQLTDLGGEKCVIKYGLSTLEFEVYQQRVEKYLMEWQHRNYYIKDELRLPLENKPANKLKRSKTDNWTVLSLEETVLLADFLRSSKVLLADDMISKSKLAEGLSIITGFSSEAIRQGFSSIPGSKDVSKESLLNLQKALHQVNALIERRIKS